MNANTEYIIVFINYLFYKLSLFPILLRQVIECIEQDGSHVVVVVRHIRCGRVPIEESRTEADDTTLTKLTVSTLQFP